MAAASSGFVHVGGAVPHSLSTSPSPEAATSTFAPAPKDPPHGSSTDVMEGDEGREVHSAWLMGPHEGAQHHAQLDASSGGGGQGGATPQTHASSASLMRLGLLMAVTMTAHNLVCVCALHTCCLSRGGAGRGGEGTRISFTEQPRISHHPAIQALSQKHPLVFRGSAEFIPPAFASFCPCDMLHS